MPDVYTAIADATRRAILDELTARDDQTLFEICSRLLARHGVTSSRQAISQHLGVLEEAGLVATRRVGRTKVHTLLAEPLREITDRWPVLRPHHLKPEREPAMPRITVTSVFVEDQLHARDFYTRVLGFAVKHEVPVGDDLWLTVVDPTDPDGLELLLEPNKHPAVVPYTSALVADGIPALVVTVDDATATYEELLAKGVTFTQPPTNVGPVTIAIFDDTCGNLVQLSSANA